MSAFTPPPPTFAATREALRALACYAISPARKARTGRIGLQPTGSGIATQPFDDGTRIAVHGDRLRVEPDRDAPITTLRAAAKLLGIALSPDPGVGHDLPPFTPDERLAVDAEASLWLGAWYAVGSRLLDRLAGRLDEGSVTEAQLWPEHFDLAVTADVDGAAVNIGFSPGDSHSPEPYVYVGPHDRARLTGRDWNAPFGASLAHAQLRASDDPDGTIERFIERGLRLVGARSATTAPIH
jgi:hypothetical protein